MMENVKINVLEAADGKAALSRMITHVPDLVLMDLRMPVMDGFESLTRIKNYEHLKAIPVIAVTTATSIGLLMNDDPSAC